MKILFVDHHFHRKTRSADFFIAILEKVFEVTVRHVDPRMAALADLTHLDRSFDAVILWQMDFLAPVILAQGVPTIVVPMFDGSSQMPDLHWLWAKQARFICFSRRLHSHISRLGMASKLVRYFTPPVPREEMARFDGLKVLLWQRRPEEGINLRAIETLFGDQLQSVHIHDAPDNPELDTRPYLERSVGGYELTTSRWFDSRDGFDRLMARHNVLVTPRRAEGIGMVMLEGLGRGMLVAAADAPTHDEYICNWINGFLFNPVAAAYVRVEEPEKIGEMAWRGAVDGEEAWRASAPDIIDWIRGAPRPDPSPAIDVIALQAALSRAHHRGGGAYRRYLREQERLVESMSGIRIAGTLDKAGRYDPERPGRARGRTDAPPEWLAQNRLTAADLLAGRFVIAGEVRPHFGGARIATGSLELAFCAEPRLAVSGLLRLRIQPWDAEFTVAINGRRLRAQTQAGEDGWLNYPLPSGPLRIDNRVKITPTTIGAQQGDKTPSGLTITALELA